jgi:putative drug exporter of the RND superfamily
MFTLEKLLIHLSHFLSRYRKGCSLALVALWCLTGIYLGAQKHPPQRMSGSGATNSSAYRANRISESYFGFNHERVLALVFEPGKQPDETLLKALRSNPDVYQVQALPSEPGTRHLIYSIQLRLDLPIFEAEALVPALRQTIDAWAKPKNIQTWLTGQQAFFYDMAMASKEDTAKTEGWGLLFAFVVLVFCFGSLLAAALPLLLGLATLLGTQALIYALGIGNTETSVILNSMLGLGLTIDYALFMVSRYREERLKHAPEQALQHTLKATGRTLIYSALIMAISLVALMIPEVEAMRGTLTNLLLVVGLALWNALTLLPLLLLGCDRYLGWPTALNTRIMNWHNQARWEKLAQHVTGRPWRYFLLSLGLLLILIYPATSMRLWQPLHQLTPPSSDSSQGFQRAAEDTWKGQLAPVIVTQEAPNVLTPEALARNQDLTRALQAMPEVGKVYSLTAGQDSVESYASLYAQLELVRRLTGNGLPLVKDTDHSTQVTLLSVFPRNPLDIQDTYTILDFVEIYQAQHQAESSLEIGGLIARAKSLNAELYGYGVWIFLLVSGGIVITLSFYLRSVVLPLKAAIMNFLPIFASYGILVWAYMWGGISEHPGIITIVPVVLFCIVFGLSMDYEVLILSRIHEAWHDTGDVRQAVIQGMSRSGGIITGAALILLGVFSPGIFSSSPVVREISLGITATILLDATLVRLLLVPSFMMLMGKWNWWSPFHKKSLPLD